MLLNKSGLSPLLYADNVALPAFARRCCSNQSIFNISCLPGPQQYTCSSGFAAVGQTNMLGQTNRHTP